MTNKSQKEAIQRAAKLSRKLNKTLASREHSPMHEYEYSNTVFDILVLDSVVQVIAQVDGNIYCVCAYGYTK